MASMKHKVAYELYMSICTLADQEVKYSLARMVLNSILRGDGSAIQELEEPCRTYVGSQYALIKDSLKVLTVNDKKLLGENLINEVFLHKQFIGEARNRDKTYLEREEAKLKETLKEVMSRVLLAFVADNKNLKEDYTKFQAEFEKYSEINKTIAKLSDTASEQKAGTIETYRKKREAEAEHLIDKYSSLNLTKDLLRTVIEMDFSQDRINNIKSRKASSNENTGAA